MIDDLRRRMTAQADHLTFHAWWLAEGYTAAELLVMGRVAPDIDNAETERWLPERVTLTQMLTLRGWRRELQESMDGEESAGYEIALVPPPAAMAADRRRMALEPDDCRQCWQEGRYLTPSESER